MVHPHIQQSSDGADIANDPQWAVGSEGGAAPGAGLPPIGGGVNRWAATLTGMVGIRLSDTAGHRESFNSTWRAGRTTIGGDEVYQQRLVVVRKRLFSW